jgi:putative ABC transport system permease protein
METFWQDLRYGFRMLQKNPGLSAIAIVTLALGVGANTALFTVVNGVLLNPLPYPRPQQLVALYSHTAEYPHSSISYPNFLDWERENRSFSAIAAFRGDDFNLTGMGEPERLKTDMVSAEFFPMLGVNPVKGRLFTRQEDRLGAAPVVLISEGLWRRKFGASSDVVGKSMVLNATLYTVIGVMPASFHFQNDNFYANADVYVPLGQWNEQLFRNRATGMGMDAVGRLKPGVSFAHAKEDMSALATRLGEIYPDADKDSGVALVPLKENLVGDVQPFLLLLLAAVGFVLLIACANVANLLLARSTGRAREFAIRTAMGASGARMIRQILTECVLLAFAGGFIGVLLATWGTRVAIKMLPDVLPRANEIHLDSRVLLFTVAVSLLAGILFGLIPALKTSRTEIHETLKKGGRGGSGTRHRTLGTIVAVEMALALVLLTGAGLMIRSLAKLWNMNPGFNPENVLSFGLAASQPLGETPAGIRASLRQLHDEIAAVPGVHAVALKAGSSPMVGDSDLPFWLEGEAKPSSMSDMKVSLFYATQPDYLNVMQIPLLRGRFLIESDTEKTQFVIVIDEQFAKEFFGDQDPIGKRVNFAIIDKTAEIVGVVGHVKQFGLDSDLASPVQAQCYFPLIQVPDSLFSLIAQGVQGVARTEPSLLRDLSPINHAVGYVNNQIVVYGAQTMNDVIANSLAIKRFSMLLLGAFAALATLLSCVGIYGVLAYIAGQRTHEIGIRMALGAERRDVLRMMLGHAGKMALIGVTVGLIAALALTRLMASMLFGISTHDPLTFSGVAVLLMLVALAACLIPARRATRIDPMVALRYE